MRIEEIPNVQLVLSRIQEIENRFVKEAPIQSKEQTFDSILKAEREKSISNFEKEKSFGKDLKNIEPSLSKIIHQESEKNNLDPRLVQSVIKAESNFKTDAVSPKGAIGLMQLMPSTANSLGVEDPFDPAENVAGGTKFLSDLLNKYKNLDHALAAYNAGPSAVDRYSGIPPYRETRNYVEKVKKFYSSKTE